MNAQVLTLEPIRVVMLRHTGPYDELAAVFDRLSGWVDSNDVPVQRFIGLYWDNPEFVPAEKLRSAACVEIPSDYEVKDSGGLPLILDLVAGGDYVFTTFTGPYPDLEESWSNLVGYTEGTLRKVISENPSFEVYVNDPSDTPPSQLITELYLPIL